MNNLDRELIKSVCSNDIKNAKKAVRLILEKDTTQKNSAFCNHMLTKLNNSAMNLMELPHDLKGLLVMEDVSTSFNENRYYLSRREQEASKKIMNVSKAAGKLADIGVRFVNSTLLYGVSGTGKTTFGRYIAYKMGLPFAYMNFSRVVDSCLGETSKNISKAFDFVKEKQKCVFMLDEVDAIGIQRGKESTSEMSRVVISLMQNLDMLDNDVVLIGATNRRDMIDPALLRRFNTKHEVMPLDSVDREYMAKKFFIDVGYEIPEEDVADLVVKSSTQADLTNGMVMLLVQHYAEMEGK